MNGNINHMISCPEEEVSFFWGLDTDWQKYWSPAGCADTKIAVPFVDKIYNLGDNGHLAYAGAVIGTHDAITIGMWQ
jgi:hypothetical protein